MAMAAPGLACELRWPDPEIRIPGQVRSFIRMECNAARGFGEETVNECVAAEGYAYRAVVTMLTDPVTGDRAVERYRICTGGLGTLGGMFHRRKADCIGMPLRINWRFEFMQEAHADPLTRFAQLRSSHPTAPAQSVPPDR